MPGVGGLGGRDWAAMVLLSLCASLCPVVALCPCEERGTLPVSLSFGYYFRGSSGHRVSCLVGKMVARIGVSDAWSQAGFLNPIPQLPQTQAAHTVFGFYDPFCQDLVSLLVGMIAAFRKAP